MGKRWGKCQISTVLQKQWGVHTFFPRVWWGGSGKEHSHDKHTWCGRAHICMWTCMV